MKSWSRKLRCELRLILLNVELICRCKRLISEGRCVMMKEVRLSVIGRSGGCLWGIGLVLMVGVAVVVAILWFYQYIGGLCGTASRRCSMDNVTVFMCICSSHLLCETRRLFLKRITGIADYDLKLAWMLRHRLLRRHTRRCSRMVLQLLLLQLQALHIQCCAHWVVIASSISWIGEIIDATTKASVLQCGGRRIQRSHRRILLDSW